MVWADCEASTEAAYEPALNEARSKPVMGLAAQRRMLAVVLVPWPAERETDCQSSAAHTEAHEQTDSPGIGMS